MLHGVFEILYATRYEIALENVSKRYLLTSMVSVEFIFIRKGSTRYLVYTFMRELGGHMVRTMCINRTKFVFN